MARANILIRLSTAFAIFIATVPTFAYEVTLAQAPGSIQLFRFLKHHDPKSIAGLCVAPPKLPPAQILSQAGVRTVNAYASEIETLARGVQQIQTLAGGSFSPIKGAEFRFKNTNVKSTGVASGSFSGTCVHINRSGSKADNNLAHLIHELGHHVGNREALYAKYRAATPKACHFSLRARHVLPGVQARNEEFAEVFAAFVLNPDLLLKSGPNCKTAHSFFAEQVFEHGTRYARCGSALPGSETLVAEIEKPMTKPAPRKPETPRVPASRKTSEPCDDDPVKGVLSLGAHLRALYPDVR